MTRLPRTADRPSCALAAVPPAGTRGGLTTRGGLMDDSLLEAIAEQVHQGWADEKIRQGFADHTCSERGVTGFGLVTIPCCDLPLEKHHADMLPYAELAEHVKEYDRATVRAVFDGIAAAGYRVVKAD